MADKLIIALVNANPESLIEASLPLLQATVAASMEYDVEVIFSGRSGKLAIKGFAETIFSSNDDKNEKQRNDEKDSDIEKSLQDYITEAYEAGVLFKVCTSALELWGDSLIPEIHEIVGGTYLISEAMDPDTVTFTY
ncbi:MAG: DsrE family protein [Pseudomonadota bacterium]